MHLAGAWIVAIALAQGTAATFRDADDIRELTRLESVWNDAHLHGDADALDRIWAEDFTVTVPNMPVMTRADALGVFRTKRLSFQHYESSDLGFRIYGDAALVTGRLRRTRSMNDRTVEDDWRFTKVYVRRGDQWKVVAFHASPAAP
jgi:ketosteroid isomerase-like protein